MPAPFPPEQDPDVLESSPHWGRAAALLERVPRWLTLTMVALLLTGGGAVLVLGHRGHAGPGRAGPAARAFSVPAACDPFDDWTGSHLASGFRVVFGGIAVAPTALPLLTRVQALRPPRTAGPWRYEWETEFAYRGGRPPVTISVPAGWQRQISLLGTASAASAASAADAAGAAGAAKESGTASNTLHIPSCPPRGSWNTFFRIFYVSTPTACAPLRVQAAGRTATVWFGFGTRCPTGFKAGRSRATGTGQGQAAAGAVLIPPSCDRLRHGTTSRDRRGFRILLGVAEPLGLGARCPAAASGSAAAGGSAAVSGRSAARR